MLFRAAILERISLGEVTVAFRYWRKPTVKTGGRLRTPVGELAIDSVKRCEIDDVSEGDARAAGFRDRLQLLDALEKRADSQLFRIAFHVDRPDSRISLRQQDRLEPAQVEEIATELDRLDAAWTRQVMRLIAGRSGITAKELGTALDMEKQTLKRAVRKLKELGLTESLQSGYRLSPRGRAFLGAPEAEAHRDGGPAPTRGS